MNDAHLHIILVHIPIVLVPTGAVILLAGLCRRSAAAASMAFSIIVAAALFAIPAFLLGPGAEEIVEHLPGVSEEVIESHAEAAETAFWLTAATGLGSLLSLVSLRRRLSWRRPVSLATLALSFLASGFLIYAGNQGGKIRHPEAYTPDDSQNNHG